MKNLYALIGCLIYFTSVFAQYDKQWIFGSSASTGAGVLGGVDFTKTPPSPYVFPIEKVGKIVQFGETTASASDEDGNLLFATDGFHIWNRNGELMPNGRGVNFKTLDTTQQNYVGSASQGSLIVKVPCEENLYYVFAVGQMELFAAFGDLYYSVVDMNLNNGLGDVVADKRSILLNKLYTEHMTVVQGRGNYLWLLVTERTKRELHAYKITVNGIEPVPVASKPGIVVFGLGWLVGNNKVDKLAFTEHYGNSAYIMDFDNSTGIATNGVRIPRINFSVYGAAFSPNDSLLYITSHGGDGTILQIEVYGNNYPLQIIDNEAFNFTALQKGPDNKIYALGSDKKSLSVIHEPNNIGPACNLEKKYVVFPDTVTLHGGLPNTIGVFKSDKKLTHTVKHIIDTITCGKSVNLIATDTFLDKTTRWNTGEMTSLITVTSSGVYVANTFSTTECLEHVDSYIVTIHNVPEVEIITQTACPTLDDGKAWVSIRGIDMSKVQSITWYDAERDNVIAYGDSLINVKANNYWVKLQYAGCESWHQFEIDKFTSRINFDLDSLLCVRTSHEIINLTDTLYKEFWWYKNDELQTQNRNFYADYNDTGFTTIKLVGKLEYCLDSMERTVYVDPRVFTKFSLNREDLCVGEMALLLADEHYSVKNYIWSNGKHSYQTIDPAYKMSLDEAGEYEISLTTSYRVCPDTNYKQKIITYPTPQVYLGKDTGLCNGGSPIRLENLLGERTGDYKYQWSTGDTSRTIQVTTPGTYWLKQTSTSIGCTGFGSIEISKDCFVDIPNAFSPNGDGVNDYFFPRKWLSSGVVKFHLQIFSRWGQLIYETHQTEGLGWDGKWNDKPQPMGVYIYRISVVHKNGAAEYYEGNVTLVR